MNSVRWRKVDLHIHSDASHDCSVSVNDLVNEIIAKKSTYSQLLIITTLTMSMQLEQ